MEQPFLVSLGELKLKLTAKPKALGGSFAVKVITPFLSAINKKLGDSDQVYIDALESCLVTTDTQVEVAVFTVTEATPALNLSTTVGSLIPPDGAGETLKVHLARRAMRSLKISCANVTLTANLPKEHIHLSLHETVVKQFLAQYNDKVNSERTGTKCNVTLETVSHFKIGGIVVDIFQPVCALLPQEGDTQIDVHLTPEAYAKWGYDNPQLTAAAAKPSASSTACVFLVRCGVVELKLTLPEKAIQKTLQDGVLTPFLGAYAKKTGRASYTVADVLRIEVDGLPVAPSLKAISVVRLPGAPSAPEPLSAPQSDDADESAYLAAMDAAKARGASDSELAAMSHRFLRASHERDHGKPQLPAASPAAMPPPTRVQIFLKESTPPPPPPPTVHVVPDMTTKKGGLSNDRDCAPPCPATSQTPNVDYMKWNRLDDSDEEEEGASALAQAEQAAQSAMLVADAAASNALAEVGGKMEAIGDAARAEVQAKVAAADSAKARVTRMKEEVQAKTRARVKDARAAEVTKAAAVRAPSERTVTRRKWSDWDTLKLDLSDDDDGGEQQLNQTG